MTAPTHKIAILVKFVPCTNFKPSRVALTLPRWDNKTKRIAYDHALRDTCEIAAAWLAEQGIDCDGFCEVKDGYVFTCSFDQVGTVLKAFEVKR